MLFKPSSMRHIWYGVFTVYYLGWRRLLENNARHSQINYGAVIQLAIYRSTSAKQNGNNTR